MAIFNFFETPATIKKTLLFFFTDKNATSEIIFSSKLFAALTSLRKFHKNLPWEGKNSGFDIFRIQLSTKIPNHWFFNLNSTTRWNFTVGKYFCYIPFRCIGMIIISMCIFSIYSALRRYDIRRYLYLPFFANRSVLFFKCHFNRRYLFLLPVKWLFPFYILVGTFPPAIWLIICTLWKCKIGFI